MIVRFGYVAIALGIADGSPNKTVTVKNLEKLDRDAQLNRLRRLSRENLATTLRILRYNAAHQIHVYRFTSKTIPLATHPISEGFDYINEFKNEWQELGQYIKMHAMRVSAHPDHYTLLNTPRAATLAASIKDLLYHAEIFDAMNLEISRQLVLHVGGLYNDKNSSQAKFCEEFNKLPNHLQFRIMLENDDKVYTASDVLTLCRRLNCPLVFDIHHHRCINHQENLSDLWANIIKTWDTEIPKIHLSSPKNTKEFRSHAENINVDDFMPFLLAAKEVGTDFDVMIEAKNKDKALFTLLDDLEKMPGIKRLEQASIRM